MTPSFLAPQVLVDPPVAKSLDLYDRIVFLSNLSFAHMAFEWRTDQLKTYGNISSRILLKIIFIL